MEVEGEKACCNTGLGLALSISQPCCNEKTSKWSDTTSSAVGLDLNLSFNLFPKQVDKNIDKGIRLSSSSTDGGGDVDVDVDGGSTCTSKKLRLTKQQSTLLDNTFHLHTTLTQAHKHALAKQLNLTPRQVEVWFQNRRARTKLKQTEVDCEMLRKWCESLSEENRRLQKELHDLRLEKSSYPHFPNNTTSPLSPRRRRRKSD
ncbi:Homeobox-leucine zipper protein HAT14 [Linum perenne]